MHAFTGLFSIGVGKEATGSVPCQGGSVPACMCPPPHPFHPPVFPSAVCPSVILSLKTLMPADILCVWEFQRPCVTKVLQRKDTLFMYLLFLSNDLFSYRAKEASHHSGFPVRLSTHTVFLSWIMLCRPAHIPLCHPAWVHTPV